MMRISVICPVFNAKPDLLRAAARSVMTQTGADLELIIVDGKSTDTSTLEAIRELQNDDPRVKVVHLDRNQGPAFARAAGIIEASGDWLGFLDADDVWIEDTVCKMTKAVQKHQEIAWFSGNHSTWHESGVREAVRISDACPSESLGDDLFMLTSPELTRLLIMNTWLHLGSCFIRIELVKALKPFSLDLLYGEDWFFFLKLSLSTPLYFLSDSTYMLRRQHESLTTSPRRLTTARAKANLAAMADPELIRFRRELRWALYATYKGIAANNLIAGNKARATLFALNAYLLDPRSIRDLMEFMRLYSLSDRRLLRSKMPTYSRAELFLTHVDRSEPGEAPQSRR